jgi:GNAT superfamily N-acetyltransferase
MMAKPSVELVEAGDAHFAWLLGETSPPAGAPRLVEGGIAPAPVIKLLRSVAREVRGDTAAPVAWFAVVEGEACGMISYTKPAAADGAIEIGYGVAASRQGKGIATAAVAGLITLAEAAGIPALVAGTAIDNPASQRVLECNGFRVVGERDDPEDGPLLLWRRDLS